MEVKRCLAEGIWQGTGEEEVGKAKKRNKIRLCLGRKEVKDFNMPLKQTSMKNNQPQTCIIESMIFLALCFEFPKG